MEINNIAFFKYASKLEYLENFLLQKVWMPSLDSLNDPFEGYFRLKSITPDKISAYPDYLEYILKTFIEAKYCNTKEEFLKIINRTEFLVLHQEQEKNFIKNILSKNGALCLAGCPSSMPMWGHYAYEHKGYCVIFQLDVNKFSELIKLNPGYIKNYMNGLIKGDEVLSYSYGNDFHFIFTKVRYGENPPEIELAVFLDKHKESEYEANKYFINNSAGFKLDQWNYENEFRLFSSSHEG